MPPMNRRHEAFLTTGFPRPALDPHPNELSLEEVAAIESALRAGNAPRARLMHKMLRLCPKQREP